MLDQPITNAVRQAVEITKMVLSVYLIAQGGNDVALDVIGQVA
jgi:hypothetical protein